MKVLHKHSPISLLDTGQLLVERFCPNNMAQL